MPNVVFVVGAGASREFGLPLGIELASIIRERLQEGFLNPRSSVESLMHEAMFTNSELTGDWGQASRELAAGLISARSVVRLLDSRDHDPRLVYLGKYSIAKIIAEREGQCWLNREIDESWNSIHSALHSAGQTWLGSLFAILQEGIKPKNASEIFKNIGFVTFNYDRIIER